MFFTKNHHRLFVSAIATLLVFSACKKTPTTPAGDQLINPADVNALTRAVVIPGAQLRDGSAPAPSQTSTAPVVGGNLSQQISSNGSTALIPFAYNTANALAGCYVFIQGANAYFQVPYNDDSGSSGEVIIPLTIPTNVDSGQFCLSYCVYDTRSQVSNIVTTCVSVLRLGTGALQVSLSWNTAADIDLWVTEPSGEFISYQNRRSASDGALDRDDVNGFGPENIFWLANAPDGEYLIEARHYSGITPTDYVVTVNGPGASRQFSGTLTLQNRNSVVTRLFKQGNSIQFGSAKAN